MNTKKFSIFPFLDHTVSAQQQHIEIARLTGLGQGRLLEIGSGNGEYLHYFQQHGWECLGIEPNPDLAQEAMMSREVLTLIGQPEEVQVSKTTFDLVRIRGWLSYHPSPQDVLRIAYDSLRTTGYLIVDVWNQSGWPSCSHQNKPLNTFSKKQITSVIQDCGFDLGGIYAPAINDPVWFPCKPNCDQTPGLWKRGIDKILGFFDHGSLLVLFAQKPPTSA